MIDKDQSSVSDKIINKKKKKIESTISDHFQLLAVEVTCCL